MDTRARWSAIGIAGIIMALLGNLPLLNIVNCILCLWVWLCGALAVVLYRRAAPGHPAVTGGQGAGLGALAGLVGAIIGAPIYILTSSISGPIMQSLARALNVQSDLAFGGQTAPDNGLTMLLLLGIDLVLYPAFGALGGLITASMNAPKPVDPTAPKP